MREEIPATGGWRMHEPWAWGRRRAVIRLVTFACWLAYALLVLAALIIFLPGEVRQYWFALWGIYAVFLLPPAWIHYNWVYNPDYLFGSNGIRRLRSSPQVEAQVSRAANSSNVVGVPLLAASLQTHAEPLTDCVNRSPLRGVSMKIRWDVHLYVAARCLSPHDAMPDRTITVEVRFDPDRMTVTAGRWRPGVLLHVAYDSVIGAWNGADIATIRTRDVLVLVVETAEDEILLPLALAGPDKSRRNRDAVNQLMRLVNGHREQ